MAPLSHRQLVQSSWSHSISASYHVAAWRCQAKAGGWYRLLQLVLLMSGNQWLMIPCSVAYPLIGLIMLSAVAYCPMPRPQHADIQQAGGPAIYCGHVHIMQFTWTKGRLRRATLYPESPCHPCSHRVKTQSTRQRQQNLCQLGHVCNLMSSLP